MSTLRGQIVQHTGQIIGRTYRQEDASSIIPFSCSKKLSYLTVPQWQFRDTKYLEVIGVNTKNKGQAQVESALY